MSPLSVWIGCILFFTVFTAKAASWVKSGRPDGFINFFFLSPVFSVSSWKKREKISLECVQRMVFRGTLFGIASILALGLSLFCAKRFELSGIKLNFLAVIPFYLSWQFISIFLEFIFLATGWHYPGHFQYPYLSKSLSEFWGRRWATWVSDWLSEMVMPRYRKKPVLGLFLAFLCSGIWHELLLNLPLYLFFDVNIFGSQTLYFLIQALGILGERRLKQGSFYRFAFCWAVILIPAPLVVNDAVLRVCGLFLE